MTEGDDFIVRLGRVAEAAEVLVNYLGDRVDTGCSSDMEKWYQGITAATVRDKMQELQADPDCSGLRVVREEDLGGVMLLAAVMARIQLQTLQRSNRELRIAESVAMALCKFRANEARTTERKKRKAVIAKHFGDALAGAIPLDVDQEDGKPSDDDGLEEA